MPARLSGIRADGLTRGEFTEDYLRVRRRQDMITFGNVALSGEVEKPPFEDWLERLMDPATAREAPSQYTEGATPSPEVQ